MGIESMSKRLEKLEAAVTGAPVILWQERGETAADVEARHLAQHPDHAGRVLVVGWQQEMNV